jgi:hypothetical protein
MAWERCGISDLNVVLSRCHVALQLSVREGFEVKVSEALHKGKPVIASRAGGIPLQLRHGHSGFLVAPRDAAAVAHHLYQLFIDEKLYAKMSVNAKKSVSDEVSTVGIAVRYESISFFFFRFFLSLLLFFHGFSFTHRLFHPILNVLCFPFPPSSFPKLISVQIYISLPQRSHGHKKNGAR